MRGTDALESGVRLSLTPYGVPSGATQMRVRVALRAAGRTSWPLACSASSTSGGRAAFFDRHAVGQPLMVEPRRVDGLAAVHAEFGDAEHDAAARC